MEYRIRFANEKDAKAVHDIYGAYVPLDYVTFTVDNPDVESYRQKIIDTLEHYPFLVAENAEGNVLRYVYGLAVECRMDYRPCKGCAKKTGDCISTLQGVCRNTGKAGIPVYLRCAGRYE